MTLKAEGENDGPGQQFRVRRTVRNMTAFATFHAHGGVFEDEGSAFIHVAFQARLFIIESRLQGRRTSAHMLGG